jgi:hypothetical protein
VDERNTYALSNNHIESRAMILRVGQVYHIIRTIVDIDSVKIRLSRNNGVTWELIADNIPISHTTIGEQEVYNNLNYQWTVTAPNGDSCIFEVSGAGENADIVDISNTPFTITGSPSKWTLVENVIYLWAVNYGKIPVAWKHQNAPQNHREYIVLHIDSINKIGIDFELPLFSDNLRRVAGIRELNVSISYFGTVSNLSDFDLIPADATSSLSQLLDTLNRWNVQDNFRSNDLIFLDYGQTIDTTYLEGSHKVERADNNIEFRVSVLNEYGGSDYTTSTIEHVNMLLTADNKTVSINT